MEHEPIVLETKITCGECHKEFYERDMRTAYNCGNEILICDDCYNREYFACSVCDDVFNYAEAYSAEGDNLCGTCHAENTTGCYECGQSIYNENIHYCSSCDTGFCSSCYDNHSCEEEYNEENDGSYHTLFNYHRLKRAYDKDFSKSRLNFGVEVEKEDNSVYINAHNVYDNTHWIVEDDGSLDSEIGYELVSPALPLDFKFHKRIPKEFSKLKDLINARRSKNCGGHIHISDKFRKPIEIARDIRGYIPLLYAMYPNRAKNGYCNATAFKTIFHRPHDHYRAINCNENTLEIRIFTSPKNTDQLEWRLKLLHLMLVNKRVNAEDVIKDLLSNSLLNQHLSTVYNRNRIVDKIALMVKYPDYFKDVEAFKQRLQLKLNILFND